MIRSRNGCVSSRRATFLEVKTTCLTGWRKRFNILIRKEVFNLSEASEAEQKERKGVLKVEESEFGKI